MHYYLWYAVKVKGYADKSDTIDALKDNIREAIGEIQLNTLDNNRDTFRFMIERVVSIKMYFKTAVKEMGSHQRNIFFFIFRFAGDV